MIHPEVITGRLGNKMFQYAYIYAQMRRGLIPDTYLQDEKYFKEFSEEIKEIFGTGIGYLEQVGVHVRRGKNPYIPSEPKYNENPFHFNICDTDYYDRAMVLFPGEKFVVFTDDPEWCREKWKNNPNVQIMDRGDDIEDFNLLASCKDLILANSSFSWWAGYLCPNPAKRVVVPKQWFSDGETRTVCPSEWIRI